MLPKTMEDYIQETSSVLVENINHRKKLTEPMIKWMEKEGIREGKTVVIVASGSSYNAVYSALPYMKSYIQNDIRLITPFTFSYYEALADDSIYVFVSQSGSSTNVVEAVQKYQKAGKQALVVLGKEESVIGKLADRCMEYGAGEEKVGYVTKGMSTMCCFFMLVSLELSKESMDVATYEAAVAELKTAAQNHKRVYEQAKKFYKHHRKALLSMKKVFLMGCGANLGTIMEGALKLSEMVHVQTSYYEIEEFIHGPDLQLTPDYTLFFVSGGDEAGGRVKEICNAAGEITENAFFLQWDCGDDRTKETLSPLYLTAFFQYLACQTAKELKITTEHPLYEQFEKRIHCKTDDYEEESPF